MTRPQKLIIPLDRVERLEYIRRMFPNAVGSVLTEDWRGGRHEAIKRLNSLDVAAYKRNHNFINGAVSKLSPYFRYGCITLKEAADNLHNRFGKESEDFIMQLAWRDYWRRVWYQQGDGIHSYIEEPKVPLGDNLMPDFIRQGITGLPCMDGVIRDLMQEGYVHNHARMWFAAYVVHWLKVDWREAADWFESYLLDGDKASNHLSWQWVASTFSSRPFYFNKANLARHTGEKYCASCKVDCPFDQTYEALSEKLFTQKVSAPPKSMQKKIPASQIIPAHQAFAVYAHDEMLSAAHPILRKSALNFFVFDSQLHAKWPLKRIQFVADCLSELPSMEVWMGDAATILNERGVGQLITQNTPNQQIKTMLSPFKVQWQPEIQFAQSKISEKRLKRFSRYWEKVGQEFFNGKIVDGS